MLVSGVLEQACVPAREPSLKSHLPAHCRTQSRSRRSFGICFWFFASCKPALAACEKARCRSMFGLRWTFLRALPLGMCACMYACMHVLCMHVCMHLCMYVCLHVCIHLCMSVCLHACVYVCIYLCICVCIYIRMHVCMHVFIYVCMYV